MSSGSEANEASARWRSFATWWTRRDPLRNYPYELVLLTVLLGAGLALFDLLISDIPSFVASWERPADDRGKSYLDAVLGFTGVPTVLLITIASLAVPSLSPAIASSLPLIYRDYARLPIALGTRIVWVLTTAAGMVLWWWTRLHWTPAAEAWRDVHVLVSALCVAILFTTAVMLAAPLRTNALQRPLFLAGVLVAGVAFTSALGGLGLPGRHLLTAFIVIGLQLLEAALLLVAVIWLLRLRHATELVQGLLHMANNVLDHVRRTRRLRPTQESSLEDYVECAYEEQEELKQIVYALAQIAMHSLHQDSPYYARVAIEALYRVQRNAMDLDERTGDWLVVRKFDGTLQQTVVDGRAQSIPKAWVDALCVEGIAAALYASAEEHYETVGKLAAKRLQEIAGTRVREGAPRRAVLVPTALRAETVSAVLERLSNAYHECVQFDESAMGDDVLDSLTDSIARLQETETPAWIEPLTTPRAVKTKLEELVINAGRLCVTKDNVPALRALLQSLRPLREGTDADLRRALIMAIVGLGAAALAARAYDCASLLIDWVERLGARDANHSRAPDARVLAGCIEKCVGRERLGRSEGHPLQATYTYMLVFAGMAAAKIAVTWTNWPLRHMHDLRSAIRRDAYGGGQRVSVVTQRLLEQVTYPVDDAKRWQKKIEDWLGT